MFNLLSASNIITKLITLIFTVIFIILINNKLSLMLLTFLFISIFITKKNKYILLTLLLISLITIFKIPNILLISYYIILVFKLIEKEELITLIERLFYNNKLILYPLIKLIYYKDIFKENLINYKKIEKNYGLISEDVNLEILYKIHKKTKVDLNELIKTHKLRFYNSSNKKTLPKSTFDSFDMLYITLHITVIVIILLIGVR